jgi:hypothetical protein
VGACGGGSGGSDDGGTPTPPPGGTTDVCSGTGDEADGLDISQPRTREDIDLAIRKSERSDGNPRGRLYDALWLNRSRAGRIAPPTAQATGRDSIDIGEVAVVQDEGDLIESPNTRIRTTSATLAYGSPATARAATMCGASMAV